LKKINLFLFFLLSIGALAQETKPKTEKDSVKVTVLEDVVIEKKDIYDRKNAKSATLIIEAKDYEKFEFTTVGEMLRTLPGMVFDKGNESKDVKFRGLDKEYTQTLINGERIPDGGEKREVQLDRLPMNMVERVEIIRSPQANFDAQGVAGTINIILKKTKKYKFSSFNHSYGKIENGGSNVDFFFQYNDAINEKTDLLLNGGVQQRIVPKSNVNEEFDLNNQLAKSTTETENKKFVEFNYAPRLNYDITPKQHLSIDPIILYSKQEKIKDKAVATPKTDGTFNVVAEAEEEDQGRTALSFRALYTYDINDKLNLTYRPIYQKNTEDKNKNVVGKTNKGLVNKRDEEEETKTDIEIINRIGSNYKIQDWSTFTAGLEYGYKTREKDKTKFVNGISTAVGPKDYYSLKENRVNFYLMNEFKIRNKHYFTPGLRYEYTDSETTSREIVSLPTPHEEFKTLSGKFQNLNPSINYSWVSDHNITIRSSFAQTVKRPQFDALIPYTEVKSGTLIDPDVVGNPELRPEKSTGFDLGVDKFYDFKKQKGFFGVNAFYRKINDKTESVVEENPITGRYESQSQNVGTGRAWGFEFDMKYTLDFVKYGLLSIKGNYSLLYSELLNKTTQVKSKFKGQADYVYNIGFDYSVFENKITFGANFNYVPALDENEVKADGKYNIKDNSATQRMDVFLGYNMTRNIAIRLSGQNLMNLDKAIQNASYLADGTLEKKTLAREKYYENYLISLQLNF
jgi:outer membrane receptor for ferrienterochelin and colicins